MENWRASLMKTATISWAHSSLHGKSAYRVPAYFISSLGLATRSWIGRWLLSLPEILSPSLSPYHRAVDISRVPQALMTGARVSGVSLTRPASSSLNQSSTRLEDSFTDSHG